VLLRDAVPGDAAAIGEVHVAAIRGAHPDLFTPDVLTEMTEHRRRLWPERFTNGELDADALLVVANVETGDVVGFIQAGPHLDADHEGQGQIKRLYVHPTAWGGGAASVLMTAALDALRERGFAQVSLWAYPGAVRACRFYEKSGFRRIDGSKTIQVVDGVTVEDVQFTRSLG
jgi:ribosomal protein S18 acetylase RimI-like enzyme